MHTVAVTESGDAWAWGGGEYGQTGTGKSRMRPAPLKHVPPGMKFHDVACGRLHTLLLDARAGRVASFGCSTSGQCGHSSLENERFAHAVHLLEAEAEPIAHVACGWTHSAAVSRDGRLWTWGSSMFGQLAHGDELTRTSPSLVQFFAGRRVTRVAAGLYHTLCVVDDRALYAVGGGVQGQLGLGDGRANSAAYTPRAVEALPPLEPDERIDQIACGLAHNLLLTSRGRVFAWGDGKMGELGLEDRSRTQATPREVEALRGVRVRRVAAGARHSLAAADDGTLWAWGQGGDFQLGTGEQRNEPRPRAVALPTRGDVVCLAAGTGHSVAVVADHRS